MKNAGPQLGLQAQADAIVASHCGQVDASLARQLMRAQVARDQFMARHKANHAQLVYAPDAETADKALIAKAAMFDGMGIKVNLVGDVSIDLSPTEFKLLRYLMLNPNRVLSKAQILDHVWEYDFNGDAGIVESYISYLRRKIDTEGLPPLIHTKRGFGYVLRLPPE